MGCSSSQAADPLPALPTQKIVTEEEDEVEPQEPTAMAAVTMSIIWDKANIRLEREGDSQSLWKLSAPFTAKVPCELEVQFHCMEKTEKGLLYSLAEDQEKDKVPAALKESYPKGEHVLTLTGEKAIDLQKCPLDTIWKYKRLGKGPETSVYPIVLSLRTNEGDFFQNSMYLSLSNSEEEQKEQELECVRLMHKIFTGGQQFVISEMFGLGDVSKTGDNEDKDKEGELCVICLSEPRTTAVLPCRHLCVCQDCAVELKRMKPATCPICRDPVEDTACFVISDGAKKVSTRSQNRESAKSRGSEKSGGPRTSMPQMDYDQRIEEKAEEDKNRHPLWD